MTESFVDTGSIILEIALTTSNQFDSGIFRGFPSINMLAIDPWSVTMAVCPSSLACLKRALVGTRESRIEKSV